MESMACSASAGRSYVMVAVPRCSFVRARPSSCTARTAPYTPKISRRWASVTFRVSRPTATTDWLGSAAGLDDGDGEMERERRRPREYERDRDRLRRRDRL